MAIPSASSRSAKLMTADPISNSMSALVRLDRNMRQIGARLRFFNSFRPETKQRRQHSKVSGLRSEPMSQRSIVARVFSADHLVAVGLLPLVA